MNNNVDPRELLQKYLNGACTDEERAIIESWHLEELRSATGKADTEQMDAAAVRMWNHISHTTTPVKHLHRRWPYYAAASVLAIAVSALLYFTRISPTPPAPMAATHKSSAGPIVPGSNKAVLTLANGSRVTLDQASQGLIASGDGAAVSKTANGALQYRSSGKTGIEKYNTLSIPRGGTYSITLTDGTRVWLNSASSMKFPAVFPNGARKVEITGEAYFEVARDAKRPFIVSTGSQTIEVLGTNFNVCAYPDEALLQTTLLEGSVRISKSTGSVLLKPGQQAVNPGGAAPITVNTVTDTEVFVAWKNGFFTSVHEDIYSVMRKISRWYDVDIEYHGNLEEKYFGGSISRFKSVDEVLKVLEATGSVHFKIEGRKIIVMP